MNTSLWHNLNLNEKKNVSSRLFLQFDLYLDYYISSRGLKGKDLQLFEQFADNFPGTNAAESCPVLCLYWLT